MKIKVKMIANAMINGNDYTTGFVYNLDKKTYNQIKNSCVPYKEVKKQKDKMMRKGKSKGMTRKDLFI
jgi:hypothetical protein